MAWRTLCYAANIRQRQRRRILPQPAVPHYFLNHIRLAFIGKTDDLHLSPTFRTAYSCKALPQISAFDKLTCGNAYDGPPKTIVRMKPFDVKALERVKIVTHQLVKG